jgi:hypothetical protein
MNINNNNNNNNNKDIFLIKKYKVYIIVLKVVVVVLKVENKKDLKIKQYSAVHKKKTKNHNLTTHC